MFPQFDHKYQSSENNSNLKFLYQRAHNIFAHKKEGSENIIEELETSFPETNLMDWSPPSAPKDSPSNETDLLTGSEIDEAQSTPLEEALNDPNALDYLMQCTSNKSQNFLTDRDSLFVKFDPLFSKRSLQIASSDPALEDPALTECDTGYETESVSSNLEQTVCAPKRSMSSGPMLMNLLKDKPTQVVQPALNHTICASSNNPKKSPVLIRSLSAMNHPGKVAIDRLINIHGLSPPHQPISANISQYDHFNFDRLHSLRLVVERLENEVQHLREENQKLKLNQNELESKCEKVNQEKLDWMNKSIAMEQKYNDKTRICMHLGTLMEEYEKTISTLMGEKEKIRKKFIDNEEKLKADKEDALKHLSNMETSFNDLLSKYEKCKSLLIEFKEREEEIKHRVIEHEETISKYDSLYVTLKKATNEKLAKVKEMHENLKSSHQNEIAKLQAMIKKQEIELTSLQENLARKIKDNEDLTAICDELINKVS